MGMKPLLSSEVKTGLGFTGDAAAATATCRQVENLENAAMGLNPVREERTRITSYQVAMRIFNGLGNENLVPVILSYVVARSLSLRVVRSSVSRRKCAGGENSRIPAPQGSRRNVTACFFISL
jgi:hypothetical protein